MLGFYILLLAFGVDCWLALVGAVAFGFSSYFFIILQAGHNSKMDALSYIAPMIAGIWLAYRGKYLLGAALAGLFLGLEINAGHLQITYYGAILVLFLMGYIVYHTIKHKTWDKFVKGSAVLVVASMIGEQDQIPPIFSAKMIDGHRAYNIARRGEVVEMKPNRITIWDASIESIELPLVTVLLKCSKGTYVRSFGRDLGEILNSGAHLISLRRLSSGPFSVDESLTVDDLEQKFSEKFSVERNK